jgi:2-keto-4-pentenoate hydratase/2-oxohepta-3-ene-1,7-dioic acid hydratase in catechol pathway
VKIACVNDYRPALIIQDRVIDLTKSIPALLDVRDVDRMVYLIEKFPALQPVLRKLDGTSGVPLSSVRLRAPIPRPPKIVNAVGNYREGLEYTNPIDMFLKSPQSVIGPGETIMLPDRVIRVADHEAELAVVIGSRLTGSVSNAAAQAAIFGYTCAIDVSARGIGVAFIGKSCDTFLPLGPWIVTADELPNVQQLSIRLKVDDQPRHDFNTSDMDHPVAALLAWTANLMALGPGDVVCTGTNHQGIGPIQDGERVELTIEGIGTLSNPVSDPHKRSWPKCIDTETAEIARQWRAGNRGGAKL